MGATSYRFGWYLAVLQLFFALCWTIYVIYLPKLAAAAGIAPKAIILVLMLSISRCAISLPESPPIR